MDWQFEVARQIREIGAREGFMAARIATSPLDGVKTGTLPEGPALNLFNVESRPGREINRFKSYPMPRKAFELVRQESDPLPRCAR